jgi:methyltransferase FkbM-like protein
MRFRRWRLYREYIVRSLHLRGAMAYLPWRKFIIDIIAAARSSHCQAGAKCTFQVIQTTLVFLAGIHERHVQNVIDAHLYAGNICLDVGANIGYFAMMMANRVGTNGKVYAFEPVPETYDVLSLNAKLAGDFALNLVPIWGAVSSEDGELSICRSTHTVRSTAKELERVSSTTLVSASIEGS